MIIARTTARKKEKGASLLNLRKSIAIRICKDLEKKNSYSRHMLWGKRSQMSDFVFYILRVCGMLERYDWIY